MMSITRPARGWTFYHPRTTSGRDPERGVPGAPRHQHEPPCPGPTRGGKPYLRHPEGPPWHYGSTALRLSIFFATTPEFWINLQTTYDLSKEQSEHMREIERDVRPYPAA